MCWLTSMATDFRTTEILLEIFHCVLLDDKGNYLILKLHYMQKVLSGCPLLLKLINPSLSCRSGQSLCFRSSHEHRDNMSPSKIWLLFLSSVLALRLWRPSREPQPVRRWPVRKSKRNKSSTKHSQGALFPSRQRCYLYDVHSFPTPPLTKTMMQHLKTIAYIHQGTESLSN